MTLDHGLEAQGYHVNNSIWAYSGSPCTLWVEQGVTQGYHGEIAYLWYYAKNNNTGYADFRGGYTAPNGSNHAYRLRYDGGTSYSIRRDGAVLATFGGLGAGTCISTAGLEISNGGFLDGRFHADTFDFLPLAWQNSSYTYIYGWNTNMFVIDQPCGQHGHVVPNCLNGAWYGSTHWADNKP